MSAHLSADTLGLPESERAPDAAHHLAVCPRCRVDARLLALGDDGPVDLEVQHILDKHRRVLTAQIQLSINTVQHSSTWQVLSVEDPSATQETDTSLGDLQLQRWLGMGTDTNTHLANDSQAKRPCVVKRYHPARTRMCPNVTLRASIRSLRHRNLGRLYDGTDGDGAFLVVEWVDGPDLVTWIRDGGATGPQGTWTDLRRVRAAFQQVVAGLGALEGAGLAHGRLHPGNVRVDGAGRVVLLDAALPSPEPLVTAVPSWNPAVLYRAPEHRSSGGASISGDLYALGVVMAEALTGERPRHEAPFANRDADVPADLRHLVTELLADDRTGRPLLTEVAARLGIDRLPAEVRSDRYDDLGPLGEGGMGEVRRVLDRDLNRTLAMKVARDVPGGDRMARFVAEAQVTAQLQHPAIVPVHEMGRLSDGRTYFTMKEIRGRDLGAVIRAYHRVDAADADGDALQQRSLYPLVQALHRVCQAVAYAHSRGVVHRDLKPDNVMVGDFGEVLVVDWGIAKTVGVADGTEDDPILTIGQGGSAEATVAGRLTGTPSYMPPELFEPGGCPVGPQADVYSLGATLYHLLAGRPPFVGKDRMAIVAQVMAGPPNSVDSATVSGLPIPDELRAICSQAMSRDRADRPQDAGKLGATLGEWLDGSKRRARAQELVVAADEIPPRVASLRRRADGLSRAAASMLDTVSARAPVDEKREGWEMQDEAQSLRQEAEMLEVEFVQTLHAALHHTPLDEAHQRLADHYKDLHQTAERARDELSAAKHEAMLRVHDRDGRHGRYLEGMGRLSLMTEPPGAEVRIDRYVVQDRRLVTRYERILPATPIVDEVLPRGSYLLTLHAPGHEEVRYPVLIDRDQHWDGVRPGDAHASVLSLAQEAVPDACFIPSGRTWIGGDPKALAEPFDGQWVWVDGFWMMRTPVTAAAYLVFLDDWMERHGEEATKRLIPQDQAAAMGAGSHFVVRGAEGFTLSSAFEEGGVTMDTPITFVDWHCAVTYAQWFAERTGQPWRLPTEIEWEKTARGVDGRSYPWGDGFDPTWALMGESHSGKPAMGPVDSYPVDVSPYGVRGMAGNTRDWCADERSRDGGPRIEDGIAQVVIPPHIDESGETLNRGGSWYARPDGVRSATRAWSSPMLRSIFIGFRLCLPIGR